MTTTEGTTMQERPPLSPPPQPSLRVRTKEDIVREQVDQWCLGLPNVEWIRVWETGNTYRVDVFSRTYPEDSTISRLKIIRSYKVKLDGDKVIDLTVGSVQS